MLIKFRIIVLAVVAIVGIFSLILMIYDDYFTGAYRRDDVQLQREYSSVHINQSTNISLQQGPNEQRIQKSTNVSIYHKNSGGPKEQVQKSTDSIYLENSGGHYEQRVQNSTDVSIYLENLGGLGAYYSPILYTSLVENKSECTIPNGKCVFEGDNPKTDVVYRSTSLFSSSLPLRYCERQILAALNTEPVGYSSAAAMKMFHSADIKIDHHLSSHIPYTEACFIPWKKELYKTPDPSGRKGVALLMSKCREKWRNDYILELSKYIHIYSYGRCFHNVSVPSSRDQFIATFTPITKKHRMVVTFENNVEKDYITEKISLCYKSGVIPVYWGPPEIYLWVPGNHTFIDPQRFKGPKELAEYLKRVDEDDDLFRYHTSNFEFERTEKMVDRYCKGKLPYTVESLCELCKIAQNLKHSRLQKGVSPPTC